MKTERQMKKSETEIEKGWHISFKFFILYHELE